jgi:predicted metal-binding membrane protein
VKTPSVVPAMIGRQREANETAVAATAVVATVGIGAACWIVIIQRMNGMDLGVATKLGSFPYFLSVWVPMMAAMMLPGVAPAALRVVRNGLRALDVPRYVGSYLGVWALFGIVVYVLYRPHGTVAAAAFTLAAGVYELTPIKRRFRRMCQETVPSGLGLGLCCVGSSIGLMLMMVALGAMSLVWAAVIAAVILAQKALTRSAAVDVPIALAIVGLGIAIVIAPSWIPGLVHTMYPMPPM